MNSIWSVMKHARTKLVLNIKWCVIECESEWVSAREQHNIRMLEIAEMTSIGESSTCYLCFFYSIVSILEFINIATAKKNRENKHVNDFLIEFLCWTHISFMLKYSFACVQYLLTTHIPCMIQCVRSSSSNGAFRFSRKFIQLMNFVPYDFLYGIVKIVQRKERKTGVVNKLHC